MQTMYLGDPHVQVSNLEESEKLLQFVLDTGIKNSIETLVILGDLLHTHSIVRTQVLIFWNIWLAKLSNHFQVKVLVGNHDAISNSDISVHALEVFKELKIQIIDKPTKDGSFGYLPYIHDPTEFINEANALGAKTLICHQTFAGSQYENGFYAPDGTNPDLVNASIIISGHVHKRQKFGKVIYPGTARWLTSSDANEVKGLWLVDHGQDGSILKEEYVDTSRVCKPVISLVWKEGEEIPQFDVDAKVTLELVGSSAWITKQKTQFKGQVSITSKITDRAKVENRKTGNNLHDFINNIFESKLNKNDILEYLKEKNLV